MASNQVSIIEPIRRILLVERRPSFEDSLLKKLNQQAMDPVLVTNDLESLVDSINKVEATILVFSLDIADEELVQCLSDVQKASPLPIVLFAKRHADNLLQSLISSGVNSYIVDDIAAQRLPVIINLTETRFFQEQQVRGELNEVRAKLDERKVIEKAKGLIMAQKRISEDQAYTELRKSAMNQCRPIADLAKSVISVFE